MAAASEVRASSPFFKESLANQESEEWINKIHNWAKNHLGEKEAAEILAIKDLEGKMNKLVLSAAVKLPLVQFITDNDPMLAIIVERTLKLPPNVNTAHPKTKYSHPNS